MDIRSTLKEERQERGNEQMSEPSWSSCMSAHYVPGTVVNKPQTAL